MIDKKSVDVVGGGMAGLVAAIEALQTGADTIILEKYSGWWFNVPPTAGIWTYSTFEEIRDAVPDGDPSSQKTALFRRLEARLSGPLSAVF